LRHSSSCIKAGHPDILEKLLKLRVGCAMSIRTDLSVTEEIAESSDLRATPFEFERANRVEAALSILEGKWKIVILKRLFARPVWRFSELERAVPGISQRMLSQQLRLLEKCELVKRTVHPQFPPKVEYELTMYGKNALSGDEDARRLGADLPKYPRKLGSAFLAADREVALMGFRKIEHEVEYRRTEGEHSTTCIVRFPLARRAALTS
jgi:DNA-binding HxlR family transcriptional regulator